MAETGGVGRNGRNAPFRVQEWAFGHDMRVRGIAELRVEAQFPPATHGERIEVHTEHRDPAPLQAQPDGPADPAQPENDNPVSIFGTGPRMRGGARGTPALENTER